MKFLILNQGLIHEIVSIIIIFAITFLADRFLKAKLIELGRKKDFGTYVRGLLVPLLGYCLALVLLAIDAVITHAIFNSNEIVSMALQVTIMVTIAKLIMIVSRNPVVFWIIIGIQSGYLALSKFGMLEPMIDLLNKYKITIGTLALTPLVLLKAILTFVVVFWLASTISNGIEEYIKSTSKVRSNTKILLTKLSELGIYFVCVLIVLNSLGVNLTSLTLLGGALGVGLGFGLQKITSNYVSGLILLLEKSIEVGDLIEMDGGVFGFVRQMGGRHTLIETPEGKEVLIPNENFIVSRVSNWTYSNTSGRVEIKIGVAYGSDLNLVKQILLDAAKAHPRCIKDPEPNVFLREFGDSSINFLLFFFVPDVQEGRFGAQSDVMMTIWEKFQDHKIEIPFPQRDLHIKGPISLAK